MEVPELLTFKAGLALHLAWVGMSIDLKASIVTKTKKRKELPSTTVH